MNKEIDSIIKKLYDENGKIIGKVEVPCPDEIIIIKD